MDINKNKFGKGKKRLKKKRRNYDKLSNDVSPTASIRSDDSCKTLERSDSVFSLVGLEILQLQPLKISHFHDTFQRRTHGKLLITQLISSYSTAFS